MVTQGWYRDSNGSLALVFDNGLDAIMGWPVVMYTMISEQKNYVLPEEKFLKRFKGERTISA